MRFNHGGGFVVGVGQISDGAKSVFAVIGGHGVQQHIATRHAGFHFDHFFAFDIQVFGDDVNLRVAQAVAGHGVVVFTSVGTETLLLRAQVEKQFALRLGGREFDHAPVFDDVFVDFSLDPMHGVTDQTHALVGVKTLDRFHQAHIAFLNQVSMGQAVAHVLAGNRHHQAQVRQDQLSGSVKVVVVAQLAGKRLFLLQSEHGQAVRRRNIGFDIA